MRDWAFYLVDCIKNPLYSAFGLKEKDILTQQEALGLATKNQRQGKTISQQRDQIKDNKYGVLAPLAELTHYNHVAAKLKADEVETQRTEISMLEKSLVEVGASKAILEGDNIKLEKEVTRLTKELLTDYRREVLNGAYQGIERSPVPQILVEFVGDTIKIKGVNNAVLADLGHKGDSHKLRGEANKLEVNEDSISSILPEPTRLLHAIHKRRIPFCLEDVRFKTEKKGFLGRKKIISYATCHVTPIILEYKGYQETIGAIISPLSKKERRKLHSGGAIEFHKIEDEEKGTEPNPKPQEG